MKEKRSYKRFDLISALAVLGVLVVLLFESIFIFEFYRMDYGKIEPYLPAAVKEWLASAVPERPVPAKVEPEPAENEAVLIEDAATAIVEEMPVQSKEIDLAEELVAAETNAVPVQEESVATADEKSVPADDEALSPKEESVSEEEAEPVQTNSVETVEGETIPEAGEEPAPSDETEPDPADKEPIPVG